MTTDLYQHFSDSLNEKVELWWFTFFNIYQTILSKVTFNEGKQ